MEGHKDAGAGQPAAQMGGTPEPGGRAETNALLRELMEAVKALTAEVSRLQSTARGTGGEKEMLIDPRTGTKYVPNWARDTSLHRTASTSRSP